MEEHKKQPAQALFQVEGEPAQMEEHGEQSAPGMAEAKDEPVEMEELKDQSVQVFRTCLQLKMDP
jgi:hypothetical protein